MWACGPPGCVHTLPAKPHPKSTAGSTPFNLQQYTVAPAADHPPAYQMDLLGGPQ